MNGQSPASSHAVTAPEAPFGRRSVAVSTRVETGGYVALTVVDDGPRPIAGQFYMLQTAERWGGGEDGRPYLPRALSFARAVDSEAGVALDFLFECVGPGTGRLGEVAVGEQLLIAGPFGNGFTLDTERSPILVAGGIGLAPIVAFDDELRDLDAIRPRVIVGMRSADYAAAVGHYGTEHALATDDGSLGHHGLVTDLLKDALSETPEACVYACGPPQMLEAIRALCSERSVPSQLALESGMACGFGACYGCVVPTRSGYLRLCVDGPVLDGAQLETALAPGAGH